MLEFIQARLHAMLTRPHAWGTAECVELQALLLVEMYHILKGADPDTVSVGLQDRYATFLCAQVGGPGVYMLSGRLGLTRDALATDQFIEVLRLFLAEEGVSGGQEQAC